MDLPSSLRRKQATVTYGKRNRAGGSVHSSPIVARTSFAATASSESSEDEAGPSHQQSAPPQVHPPSPSSRTDRAANTSHSNVASLPSVADTASLTSTARPATTHATSSTELSVTTPSGVPPHSSSRACLNSPSLSTPGLLLKSGSSPTKLSSTKSLPQRPPRAASPSSTKSRRPSTTALPAKRSASSSPRKSSSVSPSKRLARSRTPTRPAQDLASLFDAIEPQARNPFARSESQPTVQLHRDYAQDSLDSAAAFGGSPLPSPTLPDNVFGEALLSPGTLVSPSKRPRMADRMAPRAVRSTKSKVDEIADALVNSRRQSLRRTETAPSAFSDAGSATMLASEGERPDTLSLRDEPSKSTHRSEAGSARFEAASPPESASQEGAHPALGARRLAGIKQTSASNAKRTYGLQRSFLADQAEENLLAESEPQPSSSTAPRNIEDEIEAELNGNRFPSTSASRSIVPTPARLPDAAATAPRESYAELLKKWGEGADDIEWDESQDPTLNLKSITSLRSQGELRRFNDDLEYLFSGLDPSQSLSIRKSSAVELVRLLCGKPDIGALHDSGQGDEDEAEDPLASAQSAEFLRKLKASDLIVRLFDLFRAAEAGEGIDDVLDAALAVYVAKLLKTASSAEALARERWSELCGTLRELLVRADRTPRQERKDGFALLRLHELKQGKIASRSDRKTLDELRAIARISKLFVAHARSWTLRNLVLAACCSLIALPRRLVTETAIGDLVIDGSASQDRPHPSLFTIILTVMVAEGTKARQRLIDFGKGLELVSTAADETAPDLETVDVCIRFLDRGMDILYLELDQTVPASTETLEALGHLICFAIQAAPLEVPSDASATGAAATRALQVLHGLFKTLLDLSQVDANWSESLASSQPLQASILRAFLLSHRSATQLRQLAAAAPGPKRGKGKAHQDATEADPNPVDVGPFDDVVHLALALLTNLLIKQLDKARDTLQSIQLDPTCWGRRSCGFDCTCLHRISALQLLSRVFFETRLTAASEDDSNAGYLSNSIATAIAQYAIGGPDRLEQCRQALDAELPSGGKNEAFKGDDGFSTLLEAVEEFAVIHEAALHTDRLALSAADVDVDPGAVQQQEGGEEIEEKKQIEEETGNPVAAEAGQLIKDLALALRAMV